MGGRRGRNQEEDEGIRMYKLVATIFPWGYERQCGIQKINCYLINSGFGLVVCGPGEYKCKCIVQELIMA